MASSFDPSHNVGKPEVDLKAEEKVSYHPSDDKAYWDK